MKIIRKELQSITPFGYRYDADNDVVQRFIDDAWEDAPDADPRHNDSYPPIDTADPRCDAAARVTAATQAALALTLDTLGTAATSFQVIGVLGAIFAFFAPYLALLYALFSELAGGVFGVGAAALDAAFDGFNWDEFQCKLYCYENNDGRLTETSFTDWIADLDASYGATAMLFFHFVFDGLGFGGVNAAAATYTETGDCEDCDQCDFVYDECFDDPLQPLTIPGGDWHAFWAAGTYNGYYGSLGCGGGAQCGSRALRYTTLSLHPVQVTVDFGKDVYVWKIDVSGWSASGHNGGFKVVKESGEVTYNTGSNQGILPGGTGCIDWFGRVTNVEGRYVSFAMSYNDTATLAITRIRVYGHYIGS